MFQLVKRNDFLQGSDKPFVSFRPEHIGFNVAFSRIANLQQGTRVKFYTDEIAYRIGFSFKHGEDEPDSFSLSQCRGGHWCTIGDLKKLPWVWSVCFLPAKQRRFDPVLQKTEAGKLWVIQLCPAFEIKKARESDAIPQDHRGIYRYKRAGEIVYIGRGEIAKRLNIPQRKEWDFDLVEYSVVENPDEQAKWEYWWIEKYRTEMGKLPLYNKISAAV